MEAKNAGETQKQSLYGAGTASTLYIFTSVFDATWVTVPWAYQAEIFPLAVRSKGTPGVLWGGALVVVGWLPHPLDV